MNLNMSWCLRLLSCHILLLWCTLIFLACLCERLVIYPLCLWLKEWMHRWLPLIHRNRLPWMTEAGVLVHYAVWKGVRVNEQQFWKTDKILSMKTVIDNRKMVKNVQKRKSHWNYPLISKFPSIKSHRTLCVGSILVFQFIYRICVVLGTWSVTPSLWLFLYFVLSQLRFPTSVHQAWSTVILVILSFSKCLCFAGLSELQKHGGTQV